MMISSVIFSDASIISLTTSSFQTTVLVRNLTSSAATVCACPRRRNATATTTVGTNPTRRAALARTASSRISDARAARNVSQSIKSAITGKSVGTDPTKRIAVSSHSPSLKNARNLNGCVRIMKAIYDHFWGKSPTRSGRTQFAKLAKGWIGHFIIIYTFQTRNKITMLDIIHLQTFRHATAGNFVARTTSASPRDGAATATRTARMARTRRTALRSRAQKTSSIALPAQSRALSVSTRASSAMERPIAVAERTRGMHAVRRAQLLVFFATSRRTVSFYCSKNLVQFSWLRV